VCEKGIFLQIWSHINHKDQQNFDAVVHIINAAPLLDRINGAAATK